MFLAAIAALAVAIFVTVFYVLCIIFSAYCTLCIVATIMVMHYEYDAQNTSSRNTEMK